MSLYQEYHYCINKKDAFLSFVLIFLIIITVLLLNKIMIPYFYIPFTTVKILLALALFCLFMCLKPYEKIVLTEQSITFVKHPLINQKITLHYTQIKSLEQKEIHQVPILLIFTNQQKYTLSSQFFSSINKFDEMVTLIHQKI